MLLSAIAEHLNGELKGKGNPEITGICYDSRKVQPGNLFVCLAGVKSDGHDFAAKAQEQGAAAFLVMRFLDALSEDMIQIRVPDTRVALAKVSSLWYGFPDQKLQVIGITGTNGKTTTTHLLKGILEQEGKKVGLVGTIHNMIGKEMLPSTHTTPESWELTGLLDQMAAQETEVVVMEVSSHALKQHRVAGCEFDVGVFTNLTQDHLDYHPSFDDYLASKLMLFQNLHQGKKGTAKYAVINGDDPKAEDFKRAAQVPVWTYGIREQADVQAEDIKISPRGSTFNLKVRQGAFPIKISLVGTFNVYNVLAAITVALLEGVSLGHITAYLEDAPQVAGRFELVDEGQQFPVIVDYAHTPDGLENILSTAKEITQGRLITVFGCGGDRDRGKRPIMGEISGKYSDFSFVTSDNPRTEDPMAIMKEIETGISAVTSRYKMIEDRGTAIKEAIQMAEAGDLVIIAGKGHEDYQLVQGKTLHFDDREVAREVLRLKR
ncbi:UDP-N-acetylmuramoyl-L-alanyl-D-glutamate--2,6-diaminopimelate ligase [Dehalobacterium formicoaceticum]|uniref:UDP-N-acetylmuramoyl-L-alanyl-D-glutamate--2,6-diaminopimelate ligase n=1 Tax=Dehalobacterium formicoaceticum TaxID=51515 RepID=A0ABT1Y0T9_9FIRM|nr:UDP-N-acetylmuramoyl-L-alanyl-D-glutamate--2,6-diaminopimelate ligase [Dehalobacterium formicoaceticum]MCR6544476.1 UDP-N-acetylmuramoyl-L-alanyl-D-glutamate--2,6-diaminopimelate ligase [Dehalobacterium formicoaceticum]